jgi:nucleotide sugar dehydrogenase
MDAEARGDAANAVCVVGLGKIGLPLAVQFARSGLRVHGADVNPDVVASVAAGVPPFPGEAFLAEYLAEVAGDGRLEPTVDTSAATAASDVVIIVVPLVVDTAGRPDFSIMDAATAAVATGLRPGTLVIYETTLPVHTTRERFAPALAAASGLTVGRDLFVAFSPERVYSGRIFQDLRRYPKLVGGLDAGSSERAVAFYERALQFDARDDLARPNGVWDLGSAEAAELAKLAETTYRDINIAFANELSNFAEGVGIDVLEVIAAANTQPFSHIHRPGIAVGGHCIPVYPRFFLQNAPDAQLPRVARAVNDAAPARAVARLAVALGDLRDRRVVVLGAAYRGGVKETAFSGVFGTVEALAARGALVSVHDPLYTDDELVVMGLTPHHLGDGADGVILQADHEEYRHLGPDAFPGVRVAVDGRGVLDASQWSEPEVTLLVVGIGAAI